MIVYYCDECGKEIKEFNEAPYIIKFESKSGHHFEVHILMDSDHKWNTGHLCRDCLIKLINKSNKKKK